MASRRREGYYDGASGRRSQFEWDDIDLEGASASYYGDDARWKNDRKTRHLNNDEFGRGMRVQGYNQNIDNMRSRGEHYGKGPRGYQRSNERIREDVCEILSKSSEVDASEVEVSVQDGIVTLTGTILSRRMKKEAEHLVDSVHGVEDVVNMLSLQGEAKGDQISEDGSPLGGNPTQETKTGNWPPS